MDIGVVAGKAKHSSATFQERSGFTGMSRWGIKGTEDLGNGYRLSFTLEEGFTADDGAVTAGSGAFTRESILRLNGPFGTVAMGRMGALVLRNPPLFFEVGHSAPLGEQALGVLVTFTLVV